MFMSFTVFNFQRDSLHKGKFRKMSKRLCFLLLTTWFIFPWTISVSIYKSTQINNEFNYLRWEPLLMVTVVVMEDTQHNENKPFSVSFYLCIWIYKLSVIKKSVKMFKPYMYVLIRFDLHSFTYIKTNYW